MLVPGSARPTPQKKQVRATCRRLASRDAEVSALEAQKVRCQRPPGQSGHGRGRASASCAEELRLRCQLCGGLRLIPRGASKSHPCADPKEMLFWQARVSVPGVVCVLRAPPRYPQALPHVCAAHPSESSGGGGVLTSGQFARGSGGGGRAAVKWKRRFPTNPNQKEASLKFSPIPNQKQVQRWGAVLQGK